MLHQVLNKKVCRLLFRWRPLNPDFIACKASYGPVNNFSDSCLFKVVHVVIAFSFGEMFSTYLLTLFSWICFARLQNCRTWYEWLLTFSKNHPIASLPTVVKTYMRAIAFLSYFFSFSHSFPSLRHKLVLWLSLVHNPGLFSTHLYQSSYMSDYVLILTCWMVLIQTSLKNKMINNVGPIWKVQE